MDDDLQSDNSSTHFEYRSLEAIRKKLLDLSARNQLLNFKHPKTCVRVIDEQPDQLFEQLIDGKTFSFIPVPEPTEQELLSEGYLEKDPNTGLIKELKAYPSAEAWAKFHQLETRYELPDSEIINDEEDDKSSIHKHNDLNIQTLMYAPALEARLRAIRSNAESAIEEGGVNILYLVLGFLEWYESPSSDVKRLAPLFTLPVKLDRQKLDKTQGVFRYTLTLKDEGLLTNVTLKEKLEIDFNLELPEIDEDSTPEKYFEKIHQALIKHQPRWTLHRMATLGLLNFSKQLMYEDLDPNNWPEHSPISDHPILKQFFSTQNASDTALEADACQEYSIDELERVHQAFPLVYDADSSQHSALVDAVKGDSLVIEGPPGSGKSQTITNMIAACIANGKRVLFVAEKMAALSVVKSRLERAGLGDFCLELHSHNASKLQILKDLKFRLDRQGHYKDPSALEAEIQRYEQFKTDLNQYVQTINSPWKKTNKTLHQILQSATRYRLELQHLSLESIQVGDEDGDSLTEVRWRELTDRADMLVKIFGNIQDQMNQSDAIENHYWYGIQNAELMAYDSSNLIDRLTQWNDSLKATVSFNETLSDRYGIPRDRLLNIREVKQFSKALKALPACDNDDPLSLLPDLNQEVGHFKKFVDHFESILHSQSLLIKTFDQSVLNENDYVSDPVDKFYELGVDQELTLAQINQDFNEWESLESKCTEINGILEQFKGCLPNEWAELCSGTKASLNELSNIIQLIGQLAPEHWRYRHEVFDQPEMDGFLEILANKLNVIKPQHDVLVSVFKLEELPSSHVLRDLNDILQNQGLFSWFSSSWRSARQQLLTLSKSIKPNIKTLVSQLELLVEFKKGLEEMDQINQEEDLLGDWYQGVKTPLDRIQSLRAWYRAVRQEFGRGLMPRAKIGNQLLIIDQTLAFDLAEQSFEKLIIEVLDSIKTFQRQYSSFALIHDNDQSWVQEPLPLRTLKLEVREPLESLLKVVISEHITVRELQEKAKLLKDYRHSVHELKEHPTAKIFQKASVPYIFNDCHENATLMESLKRLLFVSDCCAESPALHSVFENSSTVETYASVRGEYERLEVLLTSAEKAWLSFQSIGQVNHDEWCLTTKDELPRLISRNQKAIDHPKWLETWLDFVRLRKKLSSEGLQPLLGLLEQGEIQIKDFNRFLQWSLFQQLSVDILKNKPELVEFSGAEQRTIKDKFCEYDKKIQTLQRQKIAQRASQVSIPKGNASGKVSTYSEASLIQHEASKKTRHISLRSLLKRAGKTITAIKPCFMMSPMSVSQYLKPGEFEFDLVVMDEASQIRPEDALGSVARGKSLVVVGDPKQLPPTSFFDKATDDEFKEDAVALEEAESILDSAIPMFKTRRLRWHYRSRHESLIAFSNFHFYDSDLVIFPSPYSKNPEFGIHYVKVARGRFTQGKNVDEARTIAQEVLRHMSENPEESVGIVAMNAQQQNEIEMHIEQQIKDDALLRQAYDKNKQLEEPLFVKNLENVQGDERDVIMISMTYGPGEVGGRVFQRFGPINRDVGWRRLNVLFTRSKKRMQIFSSMQSSDILISNTSKRGVKSLRAFLEYCETGHLHSNVHTGKEPDSDFEVSVINELYNQGFECEPQLGVAGYYLDIAVRDPGDHGRFLMGIECDGASYHSAKSARDRDRLRQEILESLGWKIRRIWSTDWFKNPESQIQPIINELNTLKSRSVDDATISEVSPLSEDTEMDSHHENALSEGENLVLNPKKDGELTLRDRLIELDESEIRQRYPDTDDQRRLLRPAMLEAFLHELPTSKESFSQVIPKYLREGTDVDEAQCFLLDVLQMVAEYGDFSPMDK